MVITKLRKPIKNAYVRPYTVYLPEELDLWLRTSACAHGHTLSEQTRRVLIAGQRALLRKSG